MTDREMALMVQGVQENLNRCMTSTNQNVDSLKEKSHEAERDILKTEEAIMLAEQSITDIDLNQIETEQQITDLDLRVMELEVN